MPSYPAVIDTIVKPHGSKSGGTDNLDTPTVIHGTLHQAEIDAITALETKLGIDSSAVATTIDYLLKSTSSTDPGHKHTGAALAANTVADTNIRQGAALSVIGRSANSTGNVADIPVAAGQVLGVAAGGTTLGGINAVETGAVILWTGKQSTIPSTWLLCNGQAVSRTTFANLFAVIGTGYGAGNGTTTFNVPDMRGLYPIGGGVDLVAGNTSIPSTNIEGSNKNTGGTSTPCIGLCITNILVDNNLDVSTINVTCVTGTNNPTIIPPYRAFYFLIRT